MSSGPNPEGVPPGAPFVPQGPVPFIATTNPNTMDYPRLVYTAPRFEVVAIADIIEPSVLEACEALLPTLVPPYVNQAAIDAVNATAVRRAGDTMTGPLNLSPVIPTANAMAASKQYVDTMIATGAVPEVPPVPANQAWARQTGQWIPLAGGGTVTNIATGAGLTGGPITATGTIAMANMAANSLKGNNTAGVAAPTDIPASTVLTMIGAAPLDSPAFTGTPSLPTGTAAVTQAGGTNNTTVATTAFVVNTAAAQLVSPIFTGNPTAPTPAPGDNDTSIATTAFVATSFAPLVSPVFTGAPTLPTGTVAVTQTAGTSNTSVATTAFVGTALGSYLPLTGGTLAGPGNLTVRGGALHGAAGTMPAAGMMLLNANAAAPPVGATPNLGVVGVDTVSPTIEFQCYGGAAPIWNVRNARGTAAVPTALQANDFITTFRGYGRDNSAFVQGCGIDFKANQTWVSGTTNATSMTFLTIPNGATALVSSLLLQGNLATFSGSVSLPTGATLFLQTSGTGGRLVCDGNNTFASIGSGTGSFYVQRSDGSTNLLVVDNSGNLTIAGATATKSSGTTWANPSSRDIKQNIQPYSQGLQAVLALNPVTYEFVADSGLDAPGPHIGLVHDETAHMPEMHRTMTIGEREVDGLDCSAVTWALVRAVQELSAKIDALTPA